LKRGDATWDCFLLGDFGPNCRWPPVASREQDCVGGLDDESVFRPNPESLDFDFKIHILTSWRLFFICRFHEFSQAVWQKQKTVLNGGAGLDWHFLGFITQDEYDDSRDVVLSRVPGMMSGLIMSAAGLCLCFSCHTPTANVCFPCPLPCVWVKGQ